MNKDYAVPLHDANNSVPQRGCLLIIEGQDEQIIVGFLDNEGDWRRIDPLTPLYKQEKINRRWIKNWGYIQ
jgi:hypothetical protein